MVKPEFYIEQYPRIISVIDEAITGLDTGHYEYVKTILKVALLSAEGNYIQACEDSSQDLP